MSQDAAVTPDLYISINTAAISEHPLESDTVTVVVAVLVVFSFKTIALLALMVTVPTLGVAFPTVTEVETLSANTILAETTRDVIRTRVATFEGFLSISIDFV